uniref:Calcitonin peptide-like domain-containing protein n=1 Tax=Neogobius melanostomus TaxID=47308 RepID=A0A8C6WQZ8_9GOBI
MAVVKVSAALVAFALLVCHSTAHSRRPAGLDSVSLTDSEARRLLNAIIREFIQMSNEEEQEGNSTLQNTLQKRGCNTATCVTHRLADFLSRSGMNSNFVPTNVGAKAFGRRRRHTH